MRGLDVGAVEAGAGGGQLEAVEGEGQVLIIGIVDEEPVVDGLLDALGLVALGDKGALGAGSGAGLDSGRLGEGLVVGLDVVDDDLPVAVDVDGSQGLDVGSLGGAEVGLLDDLVQPVDAVVGVGEHVLVHLLDGVVVVLEGLLDLVGGVLLVLQAPGSRVTSGTAGWAVHGRVSIGWLGMKGEGSIGSGSVRWGSWAVAIGRRSGSIRSWCIRSRGVGSRCIGSRGVGGRCVRNDRYRYWVGRSTGNDSCHQSSENLKCL